MIDTEHSPDSAYQNSIDEVRMASVCLFLLENSVPYTSMSSALLSARKRQAYSI
jgi:hypothetical protein